MIMGGICRHPNLSTFAGAAGRRPISGSFGESDPGRRPISGSFGESDPGRGPFRATLAKVTRGEVHFGQLWRKQPGARSISGNFGESNPGRGPFRATLAKATRGATETEPPTTQHSNTRHKRELKSTHNEKDSRDQEAGNEQIGQFPACAISQLSLWPG